MPRRGRAKSYPQGTSTPSGADGSTFEAPSFDPMDVLSQGQAPGGGRAGAINISNINTAIAQAAGRDLQAGPITVGGGGMGMMQGGMNQGSMGMMGGNSTYRPY